MDTGLYSSALQHQPCLSAKGIYHLLSQRLGIIATLDAYSANPGDEFLSLGQAVLVQVSDDNWCGASCMSCEKRHQTDRSGTAYDQWIPQTKVGPVNAGQCH